MKITDEELQVIEELHHFGTPLDDAVLKEARAARKELRIVQAGQCYENVVYAQAMGGVGVMVAVLIGNVSNRIIPLTKVHLKMPWSGAGLHWLTKPSSKQVRDWGGYVLPTCGPCGFDPGEVLNHRFGHHSKLYPDEWLEGLLLGEGTASVPDEYPDRKLVPMRLTIFAGGANSYSVWLKLAVRREEQRKSGGSVDKDVRSTSARAEKVRA